MSYINPKAMILKLVKTLKPMQAIFQRCHFSFNINIH